MTEPNPEPDDRQMHGTGDLAVFLGGSENSFTGLLLILIAKAQATPANLARLELAFPREVQAWKTWMSMSPAPAFAELREALEERGEPEPRASWLALSGRMREYLGRIEDMGDDERVFMLGALTGVLDEVLGR